MLIKVRVRPAMLTGIEPWLINFECKRQTGSKLCKGVLLCFRQRPHNTAGAGEILQAIPSLQNDPEHVEHRLLQPQLLHAGCLGFFGCELLQTHDIAIMRISEH